MDTRYALILGFLLLGIKMGANSLSEIDREYVTKELIREEFIGEVFLSEGGLMLGTGNQFYHLDPRLSIMQNVFQQDTIYTAVDNNFLFPSADPNQLCKCMSEGDSIQFENKKLLKQLNKYSLLEGSIESLLFTKGKVKYTVLGIRTEKRAFVNWDYRRCSEPLFDIREVTNVYIYCVD